MGLVRGVLRQLRAVLRKDVVERELDEELAFHVEMAARKYVEAGFSAEDARRQALLRFHGVERHKEAVRDSRWTRVIDDAAGDVRYAIRSLARQPLLTLVAVLTIAVGVGATAAVFSMTRALLLEPLPVAAPDRLFTLAEQRGGMVSTINGEMSIPYARYEAYAEATSAVLAGLAAYRYATVAVQEGGESRATNGLITSPDFFDVLGVRPALGRFYGADDGDVVVLGHGAWQARFGGDASVLGRVVYVDSRPYTVVGVAPRGFIGLARWIPVDVFLPYHATPAVTATGFGGWVVPFGRLGDDVTPAAARAAVDAAALRIPVQEGSTVHGARLNAVTGVPSFALSGIRAFLAMLFTTAALVLVIACTNIAGILLARGVVRRQEMAVRLALGAGSGRLVRQLLTETLVLFLVGGALGVVAADLAAGALARVRLPFTEQVALDVSPDTSVLVFAFGLAVLTGIVFGLLPALRASRPDLVPALKASAPTVESTRVRGVFVTAQLALAVVLLVAAGLFARSLQAALAADPGFDAARVVVASTNLAPHGYDEARGRLFQGALLARIRSLPDVESAALAQGQVIGMSTSRGDVEGLRTTAGEPIVVNAVMNRADAAFADAMRLRVLAGRWFREADGPDAPPAVVINEVAAARLWPDGSALGARLRFAGREYDVVGIVSAGRYGGLAAEPVPHVYFALAQQYAPRVTLHVRGRAGATALTEQVRQAVAAIDPNIALEGAVPVRELIMMTILPQRFAAKIVGAFGLAGLLLAALGLYGVLAFYVAQRTREFGVRAALGADAADVTLLVVRRALRLALLGCLTGLVAAAAVTRLLGALLVGVQPYDPLTFVAVPALLVLTTLAAAAAPAWRASRADPMTALRA